LEADADGECKVSKLNNKANDERYTQTDFRYSLGKLQEESGLFDKLALLVTDTRSIDDLARKRTAKTNVVVSIWIRPTISFSPKCTGETSLKKFSDIAGGLSSANASDDYSAADNTIILGWICVCFAVLCSIPTIFYGALEITRGGKPALVIPLVAGCLVPLGMVIGMLITSG